MKKTFSILLFALASFAGKSYAQKVQPCATDEMYRIYKLQHPEIEIYEKKLTADIQNYAKNKMNLSKFARTTSTGVVYYDIPVVFHVMHNYGPELTHLSDVFLHAMIVEMNQVYAGLNPQSDVIAPYVPYIGKTTIRFHLATIDPNGNPTRGITHHATYLTYGGDDEAKMDLWSPTNYYNIWFENTIGATVANGIILAYANFPSDAAVNPFNDGVISRYNAETLSQYTVEHETGHYFSLFHPWNSNGKPCETPGFCGDDDVDDTPPTIGHYSDCNLWDSVCAFNYFKIYTSASGGDSLVNYPDTTNVQNIMDYSSCTRMFTKGQVTRMYGALNSDVGGRSNLWDSVNLVHTGVSNDGGVTFNPLPVLPPVTDYVVSNSSTISPSQNITLDYFTCPNKSLYFHNFSWGVDTIASVKWTFSNGATNPTSTSSTFAATAFTVPGWVTTTLAATGKGAAGTTTTTYNRSVFVADATAQNGETYYMSFNNADTAKWPMFNYYNNEFKWALSNYGYGDNFSIEYLGYDSRIGLTSGIVPTGSPSGDFDDFFSMPIDLSGFASSGKCYLNYMYSGASRSSITLDINDKMEIDYSVDNAQTWQLLDTLTKERLDNKGAVSFGYIPTSYLDWSPMSIAIPAAARKPYTLFRFRYYPKNGVDYGYGGSTEFNYYSSGNNFYMDNISFGSVPVSVNNIVKAGAMDITVAPNPTRGDAYVLINNAGNTSAKITVMDVTGKVVYTTSKELFGTNENIQIPQTAISVKGLYLVHVVTGNESQTCKLVVQ